MVDFLLFVVYFSCIYIYMQVDKDFVWSLWKQAQQELPDVSAIIDMVVARWVDHCSFLYYNTSKE